MKSESRIQNPESRSLRNHPSRLTPPVSRLTSHPSLLGAFTLIEILVAVAIMSLVAGGAFSLLAAVSKAWQRGTELSRDLHAGDFVIEQVVGALRAARYRDPNDGLILKKNGSGASAQDSISWVKEGSDLVGADSTMGKIFHHIRFYIGRDKNGNQGALYTAWGDEYLQPENFDPEQVPPEILSDRVVGLSVRVATNDFENDTIEWMDKWEGRSQMGDDLTNHLPRFVEVTLYLKPLEEGDPPIEMRRLVDIPIAREGIR